MSQSKITCESCGKALSHATDVCPVCDQSLERDLQLAIAGAYLCPICLQKFDHPHQERWPSNSKWYLPTQVKPSCPHCHGFLRDRKNPQLPAKLIWSFVAATTAAYFLLPNTYRKHALLFLLSAYIIAHVRLRERNVQPRDRYAKDGA